MLNICRPQTCTLLPRYITSIILQIALTATVIAKLIRNGQSVVICLLSYSRRHQDLSGRFLELPRVSETLLNHHDPSRKVPQMFQRCSRQVPEGLGRFHKSSRRLPISQKRCQKDLDGSRKVPEGFGSVQKGSRRIMMIPEKLTNGS